LDELIQLVARRAGISSAQSALAVSAMLSYLTARLPSPVVGRIREQLGDVQSPREPDRGEGGVK
jgi:nucleoid DNA-binding protein